MVIMGFQSKLQMSSTELWLTQYSGIDEPHPGSLWLKKNKTGSGSNMYINVVYTNTTLYIDI